MTVASTLYVAENYFSSNCDISDCTAATKVFQTPQTTGVAFAECFSDDTQPYAGGPGALS